jgi:hypothetical protein
MQAFRTGKIRRAGRGDKVHTDIKTNGGVPLEKFKSLRRPDGKVRLESKQVGQAWKTGKRRTGKCKIEGTGMQGY